MAISSVLISPPPRETPFFETPGRISVPWLLWFSSIQTTGSVVQNLQQLSIIAEDNSTDGNSPAVLAELQDVIAALSEPRRLPDPVEPAEMYAGGGAVSTLDQGVEMYARDAGLKAELDELRVLLGAENSLSGALLPVHQTNGTQNSTQTLLNLAAGSNMTLAEAAGTVTIASAGTVKVRTVTLADTATTADSLLILSPTAAITETLPATPLTGQLMQLVNTSAFTVTVAGNGHNVWSAGTAAATYSLLTNTTAILVYDGSTWRKL